MKRFLGTYLFCLALPLSAVCQTSNADMRTLAIVRDLERESRPGRSARLGPQVVGDPYFSPNWCDGSVTLYRENKTYKLPEIKFDMLNYGIDLIIEKNFKSLDGSLVHSFEITDSITGIPHRFVNGKEFTRDGVPIRGFLEILCWGKLDVYALVETSLLRPNYNTQIQSGSENYTVSKKRIILYSPGTELRPMNKKEVSKLWSEKEVQMKEFQKVNKLSLSKDRDLLLMVDYFNTL